MVGVDECIFIGLVGSDLINVRTMSRGRKLKDTSLLFVDINPNVHTE